MLNHGIAFATSLAGHKSSKSCSVSKLLEQSAAARRTNDGDGRKYLQALIYELVHMRQGKWLTFELKIIISDASMDGAVLLVFKINKHASIV